MHKLKTIRYEDDIAGPNWLALFLSVCCYIEPTKALSLMDLKHQEDDYTRNSILKKK